MSETGSAETEADNEGDTGADTETNPGGPPAVVARGITMRGPWGPVYGPVDLEIPDGGVTVLVCPAGTPRDALLMTIAGRMTPMSGELTVRGRLGPSGSSRCAPWRASMNSTPSPNR